MKNSSKIMPKNINIYENHLSKKVNKKIIRMQEACVFLGHAGSLSPAYAGFLLDPLFLYV
jgi:hypothetical protein